MDVPTPGQYLNQAEIIASLPEDNQVENNKDQVEISVRLVNQADPGFVFNQFSPNGDGINDFLVVKDIGSFEGTTLRIFNRYGQLIYAAANFVADEVWDGTYEGKPAPEGTYFYILELGPDQEVAKGWIQLIR